MVAEMSGVGCQPSEVNSCT